MSKKKITRENDYDFLETKYGATPADILRAVEEVGPYKARLNTYFLVREFSRRNKTGHVNSMAVKDR
jgi:hypothetical protein